MVVEVHLHINHQFLLLLLQKKSKIVIKYKNIELASFSTKSSSKGRDKKQNINTVPVISTPSAQTSRAPSNSSQTGSQVIDKSSSNDCSTTSHSTTQNDHMHTTTTTSSLSGKSNDNLIRSTETISGSKNIKNSTSTGLLNQNDKTNSVHRIENQNAKKKISNKLVIDSDTESTESTLEELEFDGDGLKIKIPRVHSKKPPFSFPDSTSQKSELEERIKQGIVVSEKTKNLIKTTWEKIQDDKYHRDGQSSASQLYVSFFEQFCGSSANGKRLFQDAPMVKQVFAFVSMIGMFLKTLDNFQVFSDRLSELSAKHLLFGVNEFDFENFAYCLGRAITLVVNGESMNNELSEAWQNYVSDLGKIMVIGQRLTRVEYTTFTCHRKMKEKMNNWKESSIAIHLQHVIVFHDKGFEDVRSIIPTLQISSADLFDEHMAESQKHPHVYGFSILFGPPTNHEIASFCFESKADAIKCQKLIFNNFNSIQRATKYGTFETPEKDIDAMSSRSHFDAQSSRSNLDAQTSSIEELKKNINTKKT